MEVLIFRAEENCFALPIDRINGILFSRELLYFPMPGVPPYVIGISYYMGTVVPFIHLSTLINSKAKYSLPLKVLLCDYDMVNIALGIDEIIGVYDTFEQIMPTPFSLLDLNILFGERHDQF